MSHLWFSRGCTWDWRLLSGGSHVSSACCLVSRHDLHADGSSDSPPTPGPLQPQEGLETTAEHLLSSACA